MPFLDESGAPLRVIHLTQAPATSHFFQLVRPIAFQESPGGDVLWAPAHSPSDAPGPHNRTDLTSVPWPLWGFIASYGRQSAPAILHDHLSGELGQPGVQDALARAEEFDRIFRVGLRQQKVPLLRAWLMWAFVSVGRFRRFSRGLWVVLLVQVALSLAAIYCALFLAAVSAAWLALLTLPVVGALLWGRHRVLLLWLGFGGAALAPLVALQLCALVPYWLAELLVRELVDRPFVDRDPGPVAVPFVRAR